jgi:hypothetical protein
VDALDEDRRDDREARMDALDEDRRDDRGARMDALDEDRRDDRGSRVEAIDEDRRDGRAGNRNAAFEEGDRVMCSMKATAGSHGMVAMVAMVVMVVAAFKPAVADAQPRTPPAPMLADLALPAGDDARDATAIGPRGEVYDPDGKGAWVRDRAITVSGDVVTTGRANGVVALANGAVYRLAENGWSAMRLVQKGKAVMSGGARSVAAVGRQLFALDKLAGGEVAKLAMAPQPVQMIGAGTKALTIQTERGLLRSEGPGAAWKAIARAPRRVDRLIDDRWALTDRGPIDLKTGNVTPWPTGFRLGAVTPGAKGTLVIVGTSQRGAIEVVVIDGVKVRRETVEVTAPASMKPDVANGTKSDTPNGPTPVGAEKPATANGAPGAPLTRSAVALDAPLAHPVGVVTDTTGRVVVAFRDGRIAIRERGVWSLTAVVEALPVARPGAPPARSL